MKPTSRFCAHLLAIFLSYNILTTACLAGGSIGWDQVRTEIAKDDPFLAEYLTQNFIINHSGGALRVGHDKAGNPLIPGMEVGERMPPYQFLAKPVGVPGDFTLLLSLEPGSFADPKTTLWLLTVRKRLPTN